MKVLAIVLLLIALRIRVARCDYSALSCAMGRSGIHRIGQEAAIKVFNASYPSLVRSAQGYVFFYLYTKETAKEQQIIIGDVETLQNSTFNKNRPTKIITHGYMNTRYSPACVLPRDAFLSSGDYNVIVIDWWAMQSIWGTIPLNYWTVAGYVGDVGSYVATMINFLENHGMNLETTTLIGHSLGAHIMGIAGYRTRNKVNYIVGLDPALPMFESRHPDERLSIDDAHTVEVIHTNEGDCGMSYQIGHFDFYPNGGSKQPGCHTNTCSHSRVYELYAESINTKNGFIGIKCSDFDAVKNGECDGDIAVMGGTMHKRNGPEGMYYLETSDSPPYALGI